jgi:hypothetical protein
MYRAQESTGMTNQNKLVTRAQSAPLTNAAPSDAERLQNAMDQIDRLRAEMRPLRLMKSS